MIRCFTDENADLLIKYIDVFVWIEVSINDTYLQKYRRID